MKKPILTLLMFALMPVVASAQFKFHALNSKSIELTEKGSPVFVYNFGVMLKPGVAPDRARCCYLYPVYAPNGVDVTDDFPDDHPHHRGISWTWPEVVVDGKTYNLWAIQGILDRFEKWEVKKASKDQAVLAVQDGWYVGDRKVVQENVEIVAHPAVQGSRDLDITVKLLSVGADVSIGGTHDLNKGYGGPLEVRFAPRTGTVINSAARNDSPDSDRIPAAWAELTANYGGKLATVRVTEDPANPGAPNGWCLRHYGFVGVDYPGLDLRRLDSQTPLVMKYRVTLTANAPEASAPTKHVLVYLRSGKGYVHTNRQASAEIIKKMGEQNGFAVDISDDPNLITNANLQQYDCLVLDNTNYDTFVNQAERDAFKHFIESGKGLVGIHSATGSERDWPYFAAVMGGRFVRHPRQQDFLVTVTDRNFPSTRKLPPTFEWKDECYLIEHLNPDIHVLLTTDYNKLNDPDKAKFPDQHFGPTLPLSWYHQYDGGREFYLALGHNIADYSNPILYDQILGGIQWAMGGK